MTQTDLYQVKLPIPPLAEQRAIARYLDDKTGKIDRFVGLKVRLVSSLKAYRQAIVGRAVTRGLRPGAALKDSGTEWLGQIPEHWGMRKVSYSFDNIGSGTTPDSMDKSYYENGTINWINTGDLNNGFLSSCKYKVTEKALTDFSSLKIYPKGSVIIAMYGASIGKASISKIEGCTNQACCVLSSSDYFTIGYFFYWIVANRQVLINKGCGGAQPNISQGIIKQLRLSCPPLAEQRAIARYLDGKTSKIDSLIAYTETKIRLMKAYKGALISGAVSGRQTV